LLDLPSLAMANITPDEKLGPFASDVSAGLCSSKNALLVATHPHRLCALVDFAK
jgi:hypothetical protein